METVTYGVASFDAPFRTRNRPANRSYCYLIKKGSVILEAFETNTLRFTIPEGAIVGVSGLTSHCFLSADGARAAHRSRLQDHVKPVDQACDGDVVFAVGEVKNDALTLAGAYFGVQVIITESNAPLYHRRIWDAYALIEEELCGNCDDRDYRGDGADVIIRLLSETIVLNQMRFLKDKNASQASALRAARDSRIVRALMEIGHDPARNWTVDALAEIAGMSRTAFSSGFKKLTNATPQAAVRHARLARAMNALTVTDRPIELIADQSGYNSSAAFARAFKKEFGANPAQFRKNQLGAITNEALRPLAFVRPQGRG